MQTTDKGLIYWREKEQSFLPALDEKEIAEWLDDELALYCKRVEARTIISGSAFSKRRLSVSSQTEIDSDIGALQKISFKLIKAYGYWIPSELVGFVLDDVVKSRAKNGCRFPSKDEQKEIVRRVILSLRDLHKDTNTILAGFHAALSSENDESKSEALAKELRLMTDKVAKKTRCDDRWFADLCGDLETLTKLFESEIDYDTLDDIAEKHFESWMPPSEDAATRFADEVAALFVKRLFEQKYPD